MPKPRAVALGPALSDYRTVLESAGVHAHRLLDTVAFPSAVELARLMRFPPMHSLQALFALEPHYVRASEPERNPNFPPSPGPSPRPDSKTTERSGARHRARGDKGGTHDMTT